MKRSLFALAALLGCTTAMAQVYIGIGVGPTRQNVDCSGTTSCDTGDTGHKLYGGYRFNHLGAIELGYTGIGRLGLASSEATVSNTLWPFSAVASETHTNPYFGLALAFALTPKLSLTGSYDFSRIQYNGEKSSTSLLAIGLSHSF
jgi:OOP family OmpA-OmpF porin